MRELIRDITKRDPFAATCLLNDLADFTAAQELTFYMLTTPSIRAQRTITQKYSQVARNVNQILQSL